MKILKWIIGISAALIVLGLIGGIFIIDKFSTATGPQIYTDNVSDIIRELDDPFHTILKFNNYQPDYLQKESDLFSTWGFTRLKRSSTLEESKHEVLQILSYKLQQSNWKMENTLDDNSPLDIDLRKFGVNTAKADIVAIKTERLQSGQKPPTRYHLNIWLAEDVDNLVVYFRVDSE